MNKKQGMRDEWIDSFEVDQQRGDKWIERFVVNINVWDR